MSDVSHFGGKIQITNLDCIPLIHVVSVVVDHAIDVGFVRIHHTLVACFVGCHEMNEDFDRTDHYQMNVQLLCDKLKTNRSNHKFEVHFGHKNFD